MNQATRPPPKVLMVHNGGSYRSHIKHLLDAGLDVSDSRAKDALGSAITVQPDIIVLDFGCDGDVTAQLKGHEATRHIPVIALVELTAPPDVMVRAQES